MKQAFTIPNLTSRVQKLLHGDVALRNSLYLIMSTAVMAASGLGFWFLSARLYTPEQIGLSSTLIAITTTMGLYSLLGFDNVLVRFLAKSKERSRVIDTSILVTLAASAVLGVSFLLLLDVISPSLHDTLSHPLAKIYFVIALAFVTVNTLTDSVFIGTRTSKYILAANTGLSIAKLLLPLVLVSYGAYGLFLAYALAVTVAGVISFYFMYRRLDYRPQFAIDRATLHEVKDFSAATFATNITAAIPFMALPIIVTNQLGAEAAAYFNLAMTIAAMLFIVPRSMANSLFAEGAANPAQFRHQAWRSLGQAVGFMLPLGLAFYAGGHLLLSIFGQTFAASSTPLLHILVLSGLSLAIVVTCQAVLKVYHRLKALFAIQLIGTIAMVGLSWLWTGSMGASGAAWGWLAGEAVMAGLYMLAAWPLLRTPRETGAPAPANQEELS